MSEQSFEELLNENFKTIHTGEIVDGTVIDVKDISQTASLQEMSIHQIIILISEQLLILATR